jgi:pSer/pThr/pTyr-binding forkhead associated (FHA) protein
MNAMPRGSNGAAPQERPPRERERGSAYVSVVVDNKEVQRRPLSGAVTLGRSLDCDLWLDDPRLSRTHCKLEPALQGDGYIVVDMGSRNGTYVNGKRVIERQVLAHRDVITVGRAQIKFHAHGYTPPRPADPNEAILLPARTRAALDARIPMPHYSQRPLPTPLPRDTSGDTTIASQSPADTIVDRSFVFSRPPARPIVKPVEEA